MSDGEQVECSTCGRAADTDGTRVLSNGGRVCDACADLYFVCAHCRESARREDAERTEDRDDVCERCAARYYTYSSLQQCHVRDDSTITLRDSDEIVSNAWADANAYSDGNGEWYEHEENVPDKPLHEYGENVLAHCEYDPQALAAGTLVFGVELEMEPVRGWVQEDLVDALGGRTRKQYILKEDASLYHGVEIVTVPLTLEQHLERFDWERVLSPLQKIAKSGAGTSNCGMHVHINKAALSPLQIGKILVFLNSPAMSDPITTIAQRESNEYCERSYKKITDGIAYSVRRHDIVNVGARTVEIRMFRGNLRVERVLKNIEFCHALVTYCRDASLKTIDTWSEFASWLLKRRSQYPHLVKFLAEKHEAGFAGVVRPPKGQVQELITCV